MINIHNAKASRLITPQGLQQFRTSTQPSSTRSQHRNRNKQRYIKSSEEKAQSMEKSTKDAESEIVALRAKLGTEKERADRLDGAVTMHEQKGLELIKEMMRKRPHDFIERDRQVSLLTADLGDLENKKQTTDVLNESLRNQTADQAKMATEQRKQISNLQIALDILGSMYQKKAADMQELAIVEKVKTRCIEACEGCKDDLYDEDFEKERKFHKLDWTMFEDLSAARLEEQAKMPHHFVDKAMDKVKQVLKAEHIKA